MEIIHNLWNLVSTEDEILTKYAVIVLGFLEIFVTLKYSATILDFNYTKKQRNIYIFVLGTLMTLSTLFIPRQFSIFIHLIITPVIVKLVFKISIYKAILTDIIPMLTSALLETVYLKLCLALFGINFQECSNIIIYRIPYMLFIYLTLYLITKLITAIKINFDSFESLNKRQRKILLLNLTLILVCIGLQFYLVAFYNTNLPIFITMLSFIFLLTYSIVSIYSILKTINLEKARCNLEQSELHNKTLDLLYNNTRAFKHDFSNILTAFGGYIFANDMEGLSKYYDKIMEECHINNNLSTLNPEIINNAAIYNILATKYYVADELGIKIDLKVFINLNELKMDIYDFTRILGILLDNAIEAASQCTDKFIKIEIRDFKPRNCQILTIENTYLNKDIDLGRLNEKGYTSKTTDSKNHGIGLWQISKMIKRHKNILLDTSKNDEFFKQELAIYYTK